jgi:hypothetical protein
MKRMFLISVFVLLLVMPLRATDDSSLRRDGYFWDQLSESSRSTYVMGLIDGINYSVGTLDYFKEPLQDELDSLYVRLKENFDAWDYVKDEPPQQRHWRRLARGIASIIWAYDDWLSHFKTGKATYGQVIEGIDSLYKDYRNKQIDIKYLLEPVRMEIEGESQAKIDSVLRDLRKTVSVKE